MAEQLQGDREWPEQWCFYLRASPKSGGVELADMRFEGGELVTRERSGAITYRCTCGGKFVRPEPGFYNEEARAWVNEHRAHLDMPTDCEVHPATGMAGVLSAGLSAGHCTLRPGQGLTSTGNPEDAP
jgi:hypothetical protein